jgi:hypothetical protein
MEEGKEKRKKIERETTTAEEGFPGQSHLAGCPTGCSC